MELFVLFPVSALAARRLSTESGDGQGLLSVSGRDVSSHPQTKATLPSSEHLHFSFALVRVFCVRVQPPSRGCHGVLHNSLELALEQAMNFWRPSTTHLNKTRVIFLV